MEPRVRTGASGTGLVVVAAILAIGCGASSAPPDGSGGAAGLDATASDVRVPGAGGGAAGGEVDAEAAFDADGHRPADITDALSVDPRGVDGSDGNALDATGVCPEPAGFTGTDGCPSDVETIVVSAYQEGALPGVSLVSATDLDRNAGCTSEIFGPCTVTTCLSPAAPGDGGATSALPQAGPITVSSGATALTVRPDPSTGIYAYTQTSGLLWASGAPLTFSAAGGSLPGFAEGFCGPTTLRMQSPGTPGPLGPLIDLATDLTLAWSGGGPGIVSVSILDLPQNGASAECLFAPVAMTGVIPRAVLAKFGAGIHHMYAQHRVQKTVSAGGICIELSAAAANVAASGSDPPFGSSVRFQ
jgi:hypothetical protein